ncbi:hypothetical protein AYY16_13385 [Morganella psychrotolerans]|nr:hypothetical protein AYY16_13385 [Morganella psychrotolerans]
MIHFDNISSYYKPLLVLFFLSLFAITKPNTGLFASFTALSSTFLIKTRIFIFICIILFCVRHDNHQKKFKMNMMKISVKTTSKNNKAQHKTPVILQILLFMIA